MNNKKTIVTVYGYDRMTPDDLRASLDHFGMDADEFARLSGLGAPKRVRLWLDGDGSDIPHGARLLFATWYKFPGALELARRFADTYAAPSDRAIKLGPQAPKKKADDTKVFDLTSE